MNRDEMIMRQELNDLRTWELAVDISKESEQVATLQTIADAMTQRFIRFLNDESTGIDIVGMRLGNN